MTRPSIGSDRRSPSGSAELIVVGAACRDIDDHDPRGWRLGGSVSYGALTAARLGLCVRALIGVDSRAADAWELDVLRSAGVEVRLVSLNEGPVFHNRHVDGRRLQLALAASDPLPADALPQAWQSAPGYLIVPVAGELGDEWVSAVPADSLVALGWQGLLRRISAGQRVEALPLRPAALPQRADIAVVSAEDAVAGGPPLSELLVRRGQQLAVTGGALGALLVERQADGGPALHFRRVPAVSAAAVDPTGAGDVFLAAWAAARLAAPAAAVWRAMAIASAAGGLTVELEALTGLPAPAAVRDRLVRPPAAGDR